MNNHVAFYHRISSISAALIISAVSLTLGCGGSSNSGSSTPPPQQAAAPVITPNGGSFSSAQTLTVSDSTPGAVFHCTTDGSTPNASSATCPSTIIPSPSSATVVVKVYVSASGYTDSTTSTATFAYVAPQAAAPTINLATGTYTSAQTLTVTGAAGTTVHCTLDGSTPTSASGSCSSTVLNSNGTTTVKVYATESGYTDSVVVSAVITINIPVPQSVAWSSSTYTVHGPSGSLVVGGTVLIASSSCASATTVTVTSTSTDTSLSFGGQLTYWQSSSAGSPTGIIFAGSTLPKNKNPVSTLKAVCGSSSSTATLTEIVDAPTIDSITPSTVKSTSSGTFTVYGAAGKYFSPNNTGFTTFMGTSMGTGANCNFTPVGGAGFIDVYHVAEGYASNNSPLGTGSVVVSNDTDINGNGGGVACLLNGLTVVANLVTGTGKAMVIVDPGTATGTTSTATGASSSTATTSTATGASPSTAGTAATGTATVVKNGAVTTTATQLALGTGTGVGNPVAQGNLVFVPNRADHTIFQIDTEAATPTVSTISTGAEYAPVIMATDANNVLVAANVINTAATANGDPSQGAILALKNGYLTKLADAPYFDDLAIQGQNAVWISTPKGSTTATAQVHMIALTGGPEKVVQLAQHADSLKVMADGTLLAYHVGDAKALVLDPFTLLTRGSVSFASGLWGFSSGSGSSTGDYAALADGSIGKVAVSQDGAGNPVAGFTAIDTAEGNFGSFAVDTTTQPGEAKVYSVYHDGSGTSAPRVHVVPSAQQAQ